MKTELLDDAFSLPSNVGAAGLGAAEVEARRRRDGPNVLPAAPARSLWVIAASAFTQPMFLLLLSAATVYGILGSMGDAAVLLLSVLAVGGLSTWQEHRTERVLHALKELASPRCTVVRDGAPLRIASAELVVDDRLIVDEGDRLAADAWLIEGNGVRVDESQLTGESAPVHKRPGHPGADALLRAGSLVVQGEGVALVSAVGARTALGRIGGSLAQVQSGPSRLQRELKQLVQRVAILALITCIVAAALYAARDGSWTAGLLVGLTLAMALVPEEFAVVWTVMLALGAWRLTRHQVLTRQPQAIESLGTITVLCVDKTGTLTENRMTLTALHDGVTSFGDADAAPTALLRAAAMASVPNGIEPMDRAIFQRWGSEAVAPDGFVAGPRTGVAEGRPFVVHRWRSVTRQDVGFVKGAPEVVLGRCVGDLDRVKHLLATAEEWSARGLRVLAVAEDPAGEDDGSAPVGSSWQAVGLLGFVDPLRQGVPRAIAECRSAGVRVVMITGDSPVTARAIATQAGLDAARTMTGAALARMTDPQLKGVVREIDVFARVAPAQKLRIVQALQQGGDVVAMTGDGVNDAPALRAADIGVAMGKRGTDVAREASDLVLLDDRFESLVHAIRGGRRIFVNLRKALGYLFAVHVPIVGMSLLPLVTGAPVLLPLHVVFLELIIDPACSLVFEAERPAKSLMQEPPRRPEVRLLTPAAAFAALGVGAVALLCVAAVQYAVQRSGGDESMSRLATLTSIVLANIVMLVWFRRQHGARGSHSNAAFDMLVAGVGSVAVLLLVLPGAAELFKIPALPLGWAVLPALPAAWGWWRVGRRRRRRGGAA